MTVFKWSQTAASNGTADATINWQEGQAPSSVNNSARAMMAAIAKLRDDLSGNLVTAGGTAAFTLTTNQGFTSLTDGLVVTCRMHATSTNNPTLNVDSRGAKQIASVYGTNIPTGALLAGSVHTFVYDSTDDKWIVHGRFGDVIGPERGGLGASLTDPNADRLLFWDDSAGAFAFLTANTGLAISGTNINLSHLGIENLSDPDADCVMFWDDSAGFVRFGTIGAGLEFSATEFRANLASAAEMEAASASDVVVPVNLMHRHPGHPKAWAHLDGSGTAILRGNYGVASITDNGTGTYTFTFDTAFATTNGYTAAGHAQGSVAASALARSPGNTKSTTEFQAECWNFTVTSNIEDADEIGIVWVGDQ